VLVRLAPSADDAGAGDVTVIDIADPQAVPLTVNPLDPGPGQHVQTHADRLSGLFEAVLSWPQRFIRPGPADTDVRGTATG
jgi:hypothetical protein